jgi:hypothetical protein
MRMALRHLAPGPERYTARKIRAERTGVEIGVYARDGGSPAHMTPMLAESVERPKGTATGAMFIRAAVTGQ